MKVSAPGRGRAEADSPRPWPGGAQPPTAALSNCTAALECRLGQWTAAHPAFGGRGGPSTFCDTAPSGRIDPAFVVVLPEFWCV